MSRIKVILIYTLILGISTQVYSQGDDKSVGHLRIQGSDQAHWKQIDDFSVLLDWGFYPEPIDLRFRIGNLPEESKTEFFDLSLESFGFRAGLRSKRRLSAGRFYSSGQ